MNLDNQKLNQEIKDLWENKSLPYKFARDFDATSGGTTVKLSMDVFNPIGHIKHPACIANDLTFSLFKFLKKYIPIGSMVRLSQTTETIIAPLIHGAEQVAEADKFVTTYYLGYAELNPPDVRAWLVVNILGHKFPESEYILKVYPKLDLFINGQLQS